MNNLAIIGLPRLDLTRPAIAPAILSSLATQVGVKSKIYDFALKLHQVTTKSEWNEFDLYWQIDLKYKLKNSLEIRLNKIFDSFVKEVLDSKPSIIAVSVFSHNSINATNMFLEKMNHFSNKTELIIFQKLRIVISRIVL